MTITQEALQTTPPVTQSLAEFIVGTDAADTTATARGTAARAFADTLGCALAGSRHPVGIRVGRTARRLAPRNPMVAANLAHFYRESLKRPYLAREALAQAVGGAKGDPRSHRPGGRRDPMGGEGEGGCLGPVSRFRLRLGTAAA